MAFQRVAELADLPVGQALRVDLAEPVCVAHLPDGSVVAVHDTCSHQQASLSEGFVEEREVECPLHGATFDVESGEPLSLPATKPVPVYACKVEDGAIWVDLDDQRNDASPARH